MLAGLSPINSNDPNDSPPFSPIELNSSNNLSPCPILGCNRNFKGSKGVKLHAKTQHPDYKLILKHGLEGFIPRFFRSNK